MTAACIINHFICTRNSHFLQEKSRIGYQITIARQAEHRIILLTRQSITLPVTPAKQADAYYRKGGIMTGFYWECGRFPILMNDTS